MSKGVLSASVVVCPVSKPLSCWLGFDDFDGEPMGPFEVHAVAYQANAASVQVESEPGRGGSVFRAPDAWLSERETLLDPGCDPDVMYFVPGSQNDDGDCWWPSKYVFFTPQAVEAGRKRLARKRPQNP